MWYLQGKKTPKANSSSSIETEILTLRPLQKFYIDFLGPYSRSKSGNDYIVIVLDHHTRFVLLKAMSKATAKAVSKFVVDEIFYKFGVPEILHSENGKQFTSESFTELLKLYGISHLRTAIHSPQSNASECHPDNSEQYKKLHAIRSISMGWKFV